MVSVAVEAHCPESGVKVYSVVAVLFNAGDHSPVTPSNDVVGNALKVSPKQIGATGLKVVGLAGVTVTVTVF